METSTKQKNVLMLFSGGKDSFLSTCILIEKGYQVYMVTFENGVGIQGKNAKHGAERIIKRYGKKQAKFLGVQNIYGIWREFFLPFFNMKPSEIMKKYGELTISQYHCLTCRTSMYIWGIIKSKQLSIKNIADGARSIQGFVIELPIMIEEFKEFFRSYSLKLLLPVYKLESEWEKKNSLLVKGFVPKTLEPQCLIGAPLPNGKTPDKDVQQAVVTFFKKEMIPKASEIIKRYETSIIDKEGDLI